MKQKPRRRSKQSGITDRELTALLDDPRVKGMIRTAAEQEAQRQVTAPQDATFDRQVDLIRENFTPEQIQWAERWVQTAFVDMIDPHRAVPDVCVCVVHANDRTRKMGLTTSPDGEIIPHWFTAKRIAGLFMDAILDQSLKTDGERILAMTAPEQHEALKRYGIEFPWEMETLCSEKDGKRVPELWTHHIR